MTGGKVSAGPPGEGRSWLRHGSAVSAAGIGGPILNELGQVVGIASGKPPPGPGVFLAVPVERIREIFKKQSG